MVPARELRPIHHQPKHHPKPIQAREDSREVEQPVQIAQIRHDRDRKNCPHCAFLPPPAEHPRLPGLGLLDIDRCDVIEPDGTAHRTTRLPMNRARIRSEARSISITTSRMRMAIALTSS